MPRSSSIDSMVEAVWNESSAKLLLPSASTVQQPTIQTTIQQTTPQYLQINYGNTGNTGSTSRRESILSPSAGRRAKQQKNIASKFYCAYPFF